MIEHSGQIIASTFEKTWYWYNEALFWPEQIMRIKQICEREDEVEAMVVGNTEANHNIRKNKVSWHDNEELYSMIRPAMQTANELSGWKYNITCIEPVQYTVYYGDESHYHWHTDTITNDKTLNDDFPEGHMKGTIRKISCSIQLEDPKDYDGGEFELMVSRESKEDDLDLGGDGYFKTTSLSLPHCKDKGSAIFFPSFSYHRVKPVTKGIRKSLVCWFRGPKWI
jgi:PKHD-type hydroxylase